MQLVGLMINDLLCDVADGTAVCLLTAHQRLDTMLCCSCQE